MSLNLSTPIGRPYNSYITLMSLLGKSGAWRASAVAMSVVLFSLGAFGNVATVLVMSHRRFRRLSYANYLIALAVCDGVYIISQTLMPLVQYALHEATGGSAAIFNTLTGCQIYEFLVGLGPFAGSWLIVAISLERLAVVLFPFAARRVCTARFARSIVLAVLLANIAVSYYVEVVYMRFRDADEGCFMELSRQRVLFSFIVSYCCIVPLAVVIAANAVIVTCLAIGGRAASPSVTSDAGAKTTARTRRTTVMLVTVSLLFAAFTMPSTVVTLLPVGDVAILLDVLSQLFACNYAVNFYVYVLLGKEIRTFFVARLAAVCCYRQI
ncbi:galanin receptor type 2-like [Tubulanus polymorphus]|uniref:galanin receptor type 2-like n=1 Tax=Tubulanus polymorphus TaxID=672921 RepID=UPI003DA45181